MRAPKNRWPAYAPEIILGVKIARNWRGDIHLRLGRVMLTQSITCVIF